MPTSRKGLVFTAIAVSAAAHIGLLVLASRAPGDPPTTKEIRVLSFHQGVDGETGEMTWQGSGYGTAKVRISH